MFVGAATILRVTNDVKAGEYLFERNASIRDVLDTLVAAGVADTRSSALAYTVRAFAAEHTDWLAEVRAAIEQVEQVRARLKLTRRAGAPPAAEEPDEARSSSP